MFDLDKWQEIIGTISRNLLRTFLTSLAVGWGIFVLIILLGLGSGLSNGVKEGFAGYAVNSMYVWPQRTTIPYKGIKSGRDYSFKNSDITAIRNEVPEIDIIAPRLQLGGYGENNNITRKTKSGNYSVYGDYPDFRYVQNMLIKQGRFINNGDLLERRKVCVIGEQVQKELFQAHENPIGDYICIQGVYFKVVGLFKTTKKAGEAVQDMSTIFVPFTTFQRAFNEADRLHWFALTTAEGSHPDTAEAKVRKVLAEQHDISPQDNRAIGSFNAQVEAKKFAGLFDGINAFVWLVSIGTLFAGGVGISNIMLIVVAERTKEIGTRKALGATPWSIISMIVQESMFITFIAGAAGLVMAVGILEGLDMLLHSAPPSEEPGTEVFFGSPTVDFWIAMQATIILVVIGALAGLMPAIKAVSINPIKALRSE
ncbi:MAG: ABC transporter permease [Chitinophagales bacterium]|nr:ABC transporter permease [Chitinophagales bacterium]